MAEKKETVKKESAKEYRDRILKELAEIDFEEDLEAYKAKSAELSKADKLWCSEKVKVKLPRARANEERYLVVGWNDMRYTIERGKEVEVPRGVALIIEQAEEQQQIADDYMYGLQEDYERESANI